MPPSDLSFWLASDSKQVTATAILRLQDLGRLRVTDSIARFFPEAPRDKRHITIHQLLTHTAGFPHAYSSDGIQAADDAARRILSLKLASRPGTKYSYSNDGYNLLALIIERASSNGFDAFVQQLFQDAGLQHTGIWGHEKPATRIAALANPRDGTRQRATIFARGQSVANWGYRGPTGVYASARDVARWIAAVRSGRIITRESYRQLIGRHVLLRTDSAGQSYSAYGWGTRVEKGTDVSYGHSGNESWLGHNAIIRFSPAGDVTVVLSNSGDVDNSGWSQRVNRVIRRIMDVR